MRPLVRPTRRLAACLGLVVWLGLGAAARAADLLAVLDVYSETDAVSASDVELLTSTLRAQTKRAVGQRFRLMTQEVAAELLPASELKCLAGQCLAVIGKKLQAKYVIGATLRKVGRQLTLSVEAYESGTGELLGSEQPRGADTAKFVDFLEGPYTGLALQWLSGRRARADIGETVIAAPAPFEPPPETLGIAAFESTPAGAVVSLDGNRLCTAPCARHVSAGSHGWTAKLDGYEAMSGQVLGIAGRSARVDVTTKAQFGELVLDSTPSNLRVTLDGLEIGHTPLTHRLFDEQSHDVVLSDECVQTQRFSASVRIGRDTRLSVVAPAAMKSFKVSVSASDDQSRAEVFIDGARVGVAKERLSIPVCALKLRVVPTNDEWETHERNLERSQTSESVEFDSSCGRQRRAHSDKWRHENLSGGEMGLTAGLSVARLSDVTALGWRVAPSIGLRLFSVGETDIRLAGEVPFASITRATSSSAQSYLGGVLGWRTWRGATYRGGSVHYGAQTLSIQYDVGDLTGFNAGRFKETYFLSQYSIGLAVSDDAFATTTIGYFTFGGSVVGPNSEEYNSLLSILPLWLLIHPAYAVKSLFDDNVSEVYACKAEPRSRTGFEQAKKEPALRDPRPGTRVRRGPDWIWNQQDASGVGVIDAAGGRDGWVWVRWPDGSRKAYRYGASGKYDVEPVEPGR